jgi:hypothetical protein
MSGKKKHSHDSMRKINEKWEMMNLESNFNSIQERKKTPKLNVNKISNNQNKNGIKFTSSVKVNDGILQNQHWYPIQQRPVQQRPVQQRPERRDFIKFYQPGHSAYVPPNIPNIQNIPHDVAYRNYLKSKLGLHTIRPNRGGYNKSKKQKKTKK